jgi:hypothetical protein
MTTRLPIVLGVIALFFLGALIVVGVFLVAARSSSTAVAVAPAPNTPVAATYPAPPKDAVVFARQDGSDALALAVKPVGKRLQLQASVVGRDGMGVPGLRVSFAIAPGEGKRIAARACGPGCYRAEAPLPARPRAVRVEVARRKGTTTWRVPLERWPAAPATQLVSRAEQVWRDLKTVQFSERLASTATDHIQSTWKVVAPDRISYDIAEGDGAGVVIGNQRWDRQGGKWVRSQQARLHVPQPTWAPGVANAHVIGKTTVNGTPADRISFYDPTGRAWFEIALAKKTAHTLDLRMTTTAHFMRQTFGRFDAPLVIQPPTG